MTTVISSSGLPIGHADKKTDEISDGDATLPSVFFITICVTTMLDNVVIIRSSSLLLRSTVGSGEPSDFTGMSSKPLVAMIEALESCKGDGNATSSVPVEVQVTINPSA